MVLVLGAVHTRWVQSILDTLSHTAPPPLAAPLTTPSQTRPPAHQPTRPHALHLAPLHSAPCAVSRRHDAVICPTLGSLWRARVISPPMASSISGCPSIPRSALGQPLGVAKLHFLLLGSPIGCFIALFAAARPLCLPFHHPSTSVCQTIHPSNHRPAAISTSTLPSAPMPLPLLHRRHCLASALSSLPATVQLPHPAARTWPLHQPSPIVPALIGSQGSPNTATVRAPGQFHLDRRLLLIPILSLIPHAHGAYACTRCPSTTCYSQGHCAGAEPTDSPRPAALQNTISTLTTHHPPPA